MAKKLIIELDEEHNILETIEEVKKQIENGNTSGYYPNWKIEDKKSLKAKFI